MSREARRVRKLLRTEDAQLRKPNDLVTATLEENQLLPSQVLQPEEPLTGSDWQSKISGRIRGQRKATLSGNPA